MLKGTWGLIKLSAEIPRVRPNPCKSCALGGIQPRKEFSLPLSSESIVYYWGLSEPLHMRLKTCRWSIFSDSRLRLSRIPLRSVGRDAQTFMIDWFNATGCVTSLRSRLGVKFIVQWDKFLNFSHCCLSPESTCPTGQGFQGDLSVKGKQHQPWHCKN